MSSRDLEKENLYNGVKQLVEANSNHLHLDQPKLFTLFSIAFQYMLFRSTKEPGHYLIRLEDSHLADKLQRKAKDSITRNFMSKLALPRRFKYQDSTFFLDFFHVGSWAITNELPKDKIKGAIIVKNTTSTPLSAMHTDEEEEETVDIHSTLPEDFYLTSLTSFVPKTVTIAFEQNYQDVEVIKFPFIKEEKKIVRGVKVSEDIDLDSIEDYD